MNWRILTDIKKDSHFRDCPFCDLGETRTLDPLIKSQLLYQLSYEVKNSWRFGRIQIAKSPNAARGVYGIRTCDPYLVEVVL